MKHAFIISLCIQFLLVSVVRADDPIGSVTAAEGAVTAESTDGLARDLEQGSPIFLDEKLVTGPASRVEVRFIDDSILRQGEQSEMVVNAYVYAPQQRDENSAMLRLFKGVFRVVTDKITKLNPERFSVRTNYGTIGIRGCDLAFDLGAEFEEVTVVALHHADSVVVALDEGVAMTSKNREIVVTEDGVVVRLSATDGLSTTPLSISHLEGLDTQTTAAPTLPLTGKVEDQETEATAETVDDRPAAFTGVVGTDAPAREPQHRVEVLANDTRADLPPPEDDKEVTPPVVRQPVPSGDGSVIPPTVTRTTLATGSGTSWGWDVWEKQTTEVVDGAPVTTLTGGKSLSGTRVSAADFADIASDAILRVLTGTGAAGAVATKGNLASVLNGTATLNVSVGRNNAPTWAGIFNLAGLGGDSLAFNSGGGITDGNLESSAVTAYNLSAFGSTYTAPSSQHVGGYLVGPGSGLMPIDGAVVDFKFNHGANGPTVSGAGGADF